MILNDTGGMHYTFERDNRELQHGNKMPVTGEIIPLREIIGNYNTVNCTRT